jgi:hypothetical protein
VRVAAVSRFGAADRMRRDRRERPRHGGRERDNSALRKTAEAQHPSLHAVGRTDLWPLSVGAGARRPGLGRLRPSAGAGPRRAQRAALIYERLNSAVQALASWSVACRRSDGPRCLVPGCRGWVAGVSVGAVADAMDGEKSRWRTFGERVIYDNPWVWLGQVDVEIPGGERFWHHVVRLHRAAVMVLVDDQDRVDRPGFGRDLVFPAC